jgi:hypothetical protein
VRWLAALLVLLAAIAVAGTHETGTNPATGHKVGSGSGHVVGGGGGACEWGVSTWEGGCVWGP